MADVSAPLRGRHARRACSLEEALFPREDTYFQDSHDVISGLTRVGCQISDLRSAETIAFRLSRDDMLYRFLWGL